MSQPSVPPPSAPPAVHSIPTDACEACGQAVDFRATACPRCGFVRGTALPAVAGSRTAKSPRSAMWLTLGWPGAGHLYAGIHRTGTILCLASVVLFALSLTLIGPVVGLVAWLTLSLYAAIDVGKTLTG